MTYSSTAEEVSCRLMASSGRRSYFLVGGAGFIGSHFCDRLLSDEQVRRVTVYDNFSSGRESHIDKHLLRNDGRFQLIRAQVEDLDTLADAMAGHNVVIHLASNPDIARAVHEPAIDFHQGTALTNNVLEAMRRTSTPRMLYASGSGVYGEAGDVLLAENYSPLKPVSTYGASKLAGEAMIAAYCAMFGITACVFRFANVVGARQTHGVGYDFLHMLSADPTRLRVLGDGRQRKSYIHVSDVVEAVLIASDRAATNYEVFNVGTGETMTVMEIASMAAEALHLERAPYLVYSGGDRGWKGDVPLVRLDTSRIRALGWMPALDCREAVRRSLDEMVADEHVVVS
jgi:UDP-glucose 4-epimerase